jgi:protein-S-isoprenylcysteine O-methyltransferase Ste14
MKKEITDLITGLIVLVIIVLTTLSIKATFSGICVGLSAMFLTFVAIGIIDDVSHGQLMQLTLTPESRRKFNLIATIIGLVLLVIIFLLFFWVFGDTVNPIIIGIVSLSTFFYIFGGVCSNE